MKIAIKIDNGSLNLRLPMRLLLNNFTIWFISMRFKRYIGYRSLHKLKRAIYQIRKEYPDWRLLEVVGKDGKEKVSIWL